MIIIPDDVFTLLCVAIVLVVCGIAWLAFTMGREYEERHNWLKTYFPPPVVKDGRAYSPYHFYMDEDGSIRRGGTGEQVIPPPLEQYDARTVDGVRSLNARLRKELFDAQEDEKCEGN